MFFKHKISTLVCLLLCILTVNTAYCKTQPEKYYVAIEFNKVLCGYSEINIQDSLIDGKKITVLRQEVHFDFSALGRDMSQYQKFTYHIDPGTGNFIYHDSFLKQEGMERGGRAYVEEGKLRFVSADSLDAEIFDLPENVILPNTQFFYHLRNDFVDQNLEQKVYPVFDMRTGQTTEMSYLKTGEEKVELVNKIYDAVLFTESDGVTGVASKIWIDKKTGLRLRVESPSQLTMYLADASVRENITTGNWDDVILGKTNKYISSIKGISSMKVKVKLDATPAPAIDDLQITGQIFTGDLDGHSIDGIFEISHKRYKGENAPGFPIDTQEFKGIKPYLDPATYIESDDLVLIKAAHDITEGSEDLWDAACKISHWIVENINGSLLAGTARETYDNKSGLCAAQSMLMTALCRAAGIPSRVVWGCMYCHERGGSFGHHAWNEVFMGEAGWVPLDVTSHEADYVDSGHIRLGEVKTLQTIIIYDTMEILDWVGAN
ncbi:MAG: hypothetical protein HN352_04555 [Bacteroidetes bacterium]|jgi:hypothetical protein|nr:hypothetical protein [Bacteroidota bacterium]MBT4412162.1 hypothetical protein [Bacteroidota bacterium]MBT7093301.1 hypothetical protein [Bacteroidota bacterium]MBT7466287.1 hypothetical protein [Bacteroidota bacterium]